METKTSSQTGVYVTIRYVANNQEDTVQVDRFPYLIGRDSSSVQLALPDATVSRTHARLICQDGIVMLENVSATNRTAVNGRFIDHPVPLNTGDQAILGSCKLFFEVLPCGEETAEAVRTDAEDAAEAAPASAEAPAAEEPAMEAPVVEEPALKESASRETVPEKGAQSDKPEASPCYCPQCGEKLPAGATFCGNCGTEVQTEITGQPMFCASCGTKVGQDFLFCPQCGKPSGQGKKQPSVPQAVPPGVPGAAAPKKRRKQRMVGIVASVLAVAVILVAAVTFFGGRSYESVVKQYISATLEGDYAKIWKLLPKEVREKALDYLELLGMNDVSDIEDLIGDDIAEALERATDEFGENWKFRYEIVDEDNFSKAELKEIKQVCRLIGIRDMEINEGKRLEVELTITGKNGATEEDTIYLDVLKIGRSWYLGGFTG